MTAFERGFMDKMAQVIGVSPTGKGYVRNQGHYYPAPKHDAAHTKAMLASMPKPGVVSGTDYRLPPGTKETAKGINFD